MRATMSLMGLYTISPDIFDNFYMPAVLDRDSVLTEILTECAELEILYPDPDTMRILIGSWSTRKKWSWDKLAETLELEYNPLYNVDATETETISRSLDTSATGSTTAKTSATGNDINSAYGYNGSSPQPAEKTDSNTASDAAGTSKETGKEIETITTTKTRGGNIGVTMSQQLIEAERRVSEFDLTRVILEDFKDRFCILVY